MNSQSKVLISLLLTPLIMFSTLMPKSMAQTDRVKFCRDELLAESLRQWVGMGSLVAPDVLIQALEELEIAQRHNEIQLILTTLNRTSLALPDQVKNYREIEKTRLLQIVDRSVAMARSLNSGYSFIKTRTLAAMGKAYHQLGQSQKAIATLQMANQAGQGIQGSEPIAQSYEMLTDAWLTVGNFTEANTALQYGVAAARKKIPNRYNWVGRLVPFIDLALRSRQPEVALSITQLLTDQDYSDIYVLSQIASSYYKNNNPVQSRQLLDVVIQKVMAIKDIDVKESLFATVIIEYADSGDFPKLQRLIGGLKRPNAYRARAWMAIAGEARKAKQTTIAQSALAQMIADGRLSNVHYSYGESGDFQWSGEMNNLVQRKGYQPELNAFVTELRISNGLPPVIRSLINDKKFDQAQKLIPNPMWVRIDAEVRNQTDYWLDEIAIAAANTGRLDLALKRISPNQTRNEKLDIIRMIDFAYIFQERGNPTEADRLYRQIEQEAKSLPDATMTLATQAVLAKKLLQVRQVVLSDTIMKQLEQRIVSEPDLAKRSQLLLSLYSYFAGSTQQYLKLAERVGVLQRSDFATELFNQSLGTNQIPLASTMVLYAGMTPGEKFHHRMRLIERHLQAGNRTAARSLIDMLIRTLLDGPEGSKPSREELTPLIERIALALVRMGDRSAAIEISRYSPISEERTRLQQRLQCY
jgi:tetratricopeptide (TPR) repeat protein